MSSFVTSTATSVVSMVSRDPLTVSRVSSMISRVSSTVSRVPPTVSYVPSMDSSDETDDKSSLEMTSFLSAA